MLTINNGLGFTQFLSKTFDLLIILRANMLKLKFDSLVKIFTILLNFPGFVLKAPTLENLSLHAFSIVVKLMRENAFRMLLEISILFKAIECFMLK